MLEAELQSLGKTGWSFNVDDYAKSKGVIRIHVDYPVADDVIRLEATYPDAFPYFRFEVRAPGESYRRHQNPLEKNLCLLERRTDAWQIGDTLAGILTEQMPKLLRTVVPVEAEAEPEKIRPAGEDEDEQAEPISEYLPYGVGSVLIDGNWSIPPDVSSGFLQVGLRPSCGTVATGAVHLPVVQAAVLVVYDEEHNVICRAPESWRKCFRDLSFVGRWVRLQEALLVGDRIDFVNSLAQRDPRNGKNGKLEWKGITAQLWGGVFPEEHKYGAHGRDLGWAFGIRYRGSVEMRTSNALPAGVQRQHQRPSKPDRKRRRK